MASPGGAVLVVDDDRMNRLVLARSLEQDGYTTASAENGERALEMLQPSPTTWCSSTCSCRGWTASRCSSA